MSDTLDWICNEIGADKCHVLSKRHDKQTVSARRIVTYFFNLKGKSSTWIGKLLGRDHSSVLVALHNIKEQDKVRALKAYEKFVKVVEGGNISEFLVQNIRPKMTIKVPNYKTGGIETREIYVDEYKPKMTKLPDMYVKGKSGAWSR
jgi:hypothetical protein